jgi:hypothetical protein
MELSGAGYLGIIWGAVFSEEGMDFESVCMGLLTWARASLDAKDRHCFLRNY